MCGQSNDRNCNHGKVDFVVSTTKLSEVPKSAEACMILASLSHLAFGNNINFVVRIPPLAIIHCIVVCLLEVLWPFEIMLCCRRLKNDVLRSYTCFQYRFGGFLKYFLQIAFVPKRQNLVALKYKAIFFYSNSDSLSDVFVYFLTSADVYLLADWLNNSRVDILLVVWVNRVAAKKLENTFDFARHQIQSDKTLVLSLQLDKSPIISVTISSSEFWALNLFIRIIYLD